MSNMSEKRKRFDHVMRKTKETSPPKNGEPDSRIFSPLSTPMIQRGYLVRVKEITREPGKVYVNLTEPDGSESLFVYVPEPEFMQVKVRSQPMY